MNVMAKQAMMVVFGVAGAIIAIVVVLGMLRIAYLYFFQSKIVYVPYRTMSVNPNDVGLAYREVGLRTGDGEFLSAWLIPAQESSLYLLFCHGNAGNVSHRNDYFKVFNRLGLNVFIFDYRGYGRSSGIPSEHGTYLDAEAAWDFLVRELKVEPEHIVVIGRSLGGAVASRLAGLKRPRGLILEGAFTSIPDVAADLVPYFPARFLVRYDYPTKKFVAGVDCPILVMHSSDDEIIPFSHGQKLFQLAPEPKTFLPLLGGHNDAVTVSSGEYRTGVRKFLNGLGDLP
jgi:fermentation-respiration switch protein FrsA (DUF1100 family)